MSAQSYMEEVKNIISDIEEKETDQIEAAADEFMSTIENEGIIHVFGCGHSHMLAEEVFYRAGGLAVMNPILDSGIMLEEGAVRSTEMERLEGYGEIIVNNYDLQPQDLMIVVSNSGRNPVPIDVALEAQKKGLKVIAITSLAYSQATTSRHSNGKRLFEIADLVIDNQTPYGDAVLEFGEIKAVPASTISGALIINSIIAETLQRMEGKGMELPVYLSGNIDGADEKNKELMEKYGERVHHL